MVQACGARAGAFVTLKYGRELFDKRVEPEFQPAHLIGKSVVGHDGRDGGEQADGGGDQRLCNPGRHGRERRLLHVSQVVKGGHDTPDGTEQAYVGTSGSHRGEHGQIALEPVLLAHLRHPHRTARALEQLIGGQPLLAQPAEFAEARLEDALLAGPLPSLGLDIPVQRR